MSEEVQENDGTLSGLKKTIIGVVTTAVMGLGDIIESLKINKAAIITNKTELTPTQLAAKKQEQIDLGYKNLDASDQAATGTATAVGNTIQQKVTDANNKIAGYIRNIKNQVKTFPFGGDKLVNSTKEFKRIAATLTVQASEDKNSNASALDVIKQFQADLGTWKAEHINESGQTNWDTVYFSSSKFLYGQASEIISIIESIDGQNLSKSKEEADKEAERIKKQNELIRKGYDAASQKLKRDEEIRSLAPDTSVETKRVK